MRKDSILNKTELLIFLSILLGLAVGYYFPNFSKGIKFLGDIFINFLKMFVLPIVVFSISSSLLNLRDINKIKVMGFITISLYFLTMFLAVINSLFFTYFIKLGKNEKIIINNPINIEQKNLIDFLVNLFTPNVFKSFVNNDILQIIVFVIIISLGILYFSYIKEREFSYIVDLINYINEVLIFLVRFVIKLSPIGIFSLISNVVANYGFEPIFSLYKYVLVVVLSILNHALIILPVVVHVFSRSNFYEVMYNVKEALMIAFSTSSSMATLPTTIQLTINRVGVRKEIAEFVLPLGATINMNGTALYEAVAAIFIANLYGINLGIYELFVISITSVLAAAGAAAIPSAGLVTMSIVFTAVDIPLEGISIIVIVDRFLDMFRTSLNVLGDIAVSVVVNKIIK
jgi:proton glutamate symport protein